MKFDDDNRSPSPFKMNNCYTNTHWADKATCSRDPLCRPIKIRRYPNDGFKQSPIRCSDLVERLVSYTQSKKLNKSSCHVKQMRTELKEMLSETLPKLQKEIKPASSNITQTYCRTSPTRLIDQKYKSPTAHKDNGFYDYLKNEKSKILNRAQKNLDVRYICDMTQSIADSIREMCEDATSTTCPNISPCPSRCRPTRRWENRGVDTPSISRKPPTYVPQILPCTPPPPCGSMPGVCPRCRKKPTLLKPAETVPDICIRCRLTPLEMYSCANELDKLFEEAFFAWAQELPVYPNENCQDKALREDMLNELFEKLKHMRASSPNDFLAKAREEVGKVVVFLPIWFPEGDSEKKIFQEHILDGLMKRLSAVEAQDPNIKLSFTSRMDALKKELKELLKDEVANVLNNSGLNIENKENVINDLVELLSNQVTGGADLDTTRRDINDLLKNTGHMSEFDANNIAQTLVGRADEVSNNLKDLGGSRTDLETTLAQEIMNFTDPLVENTSQPAKQQRHAMARDLAHRTKDIFSEPNQNSTETDSMVKDELTQYFRKLSLQTPAPRERLVDDLTERLRKIATSTPKRTGGRRGSKLDGNFSGPTMSSIRFDDLEYPESGCTPNREKDKEEKKYQNDLEDIIRSWLVGLPVNLNEKDESLIEEASKILASEILARKKFNRLHSKAKPKDEDELDFLKFQLFKLFNKTIDPKELSEIMPQVKDLLQKIKKAKEPNFNKSNINLGNINAESELAFGKSKAALFENVDKWVNELPMDSENNEETKKIKESMANEMKMKIGAFHMDPQLMNDDFMYDKVLSDEVERVFESLPPDSELDKNKDELKTDLIDKIKQSQQKAKEDFAEQAFKHHLQETLEKKLPDLNNLNPEKRAKVELLKDDIGDAFINMNFEPDENKRKELRQQYEEKVSKYVEEHKKIDPKADIDYAKLKQEIKNTLKKTPATNKDIVKSHVEQVRMKNEIKGWAKEHKDMKPDITEEEQLKTDKMISLGAKRIYKLEKNKNPDADHDKAIEREVRKLIRKMPIKDDADVDELTEQLANVLKNSEESRKLTGEPRISESESPDNMSQEGGQDESDGQNTCKVPCKHPPFARPKCQTLPCDPPPNSPPWRDPCRPPPCALPRAPCFQPPSCSYPPQNSKSKYLSSSNQKYRSCQQPKPCYIPDICMPQPDCPTRSCRNQERSRRNSMRESPKPADMEMEMKDRGWDSNATEDNNNSDEERDRRYSSSKQRHGNNQVPHAPCQFCVEASESIQDCSRCCGSMCPYPNRIYFRN